MAQGMETAVISSAFGYSLFFIVWDDKKVLEGRKCIGDNACTYGDFRDIIGFDWNKALK